MAKFNTINIKGKDYVVEDGDIFEFRIKKARS